MELAKMDIFKSLADSVSSLFTALGNVGSAYVATRNPMTYLNALTGNTGADTPAPRKKAKAESDTEDEDDDDAKQYSNNEMAYLHCGLIKDAVQQLQGLLEGDAKEGIQWVLITGVGDQEDKKDKIIVEDKRQWNLSVVVSMLAINTKGLKQSKGKKSSKTGKKLLKAIEKVDPVRAFTFCESHRVTNRFTGNR